MAVIHLSGPKVILLAVEAALSADIPLLRALVSQHSKSLRTDVFLRILLTYLPETLEPSEYVPLLQDLSSGQIFEDIGIKTDSSLLDEITDTEAYKRVRKLHLLSLLWPGAPSDAPEDPLPLFLLHRAYRIDEETGLIAQLPELIVPFLDHSAYLRNWMISVLLPLLRFNYEYYPQERTSKTISSFENLDAEAGVNLLLSEIGGQTDDDDDKRKNIGRDLRGLIGPWMYGATKWKSHRRMTSVTDGAQTVESLDKVSAGNNINFSNWEAVFSWILSKAATSSWSICVDAIEQWDGPGDVDLGGYSDGAMYLEEYEQKDLEQSYARAMLAAAYLIPEASLDALMGVQRILKRIVSLLDLDSIPSLQSAISTLSAVQGIGERNIISTMNATYLRTALMDRSNILTTPNRTSIYVLHALLMSAILLTRAGVSCTIRQAGELALIQDEKEQKQVLRKLLHLVSNGPKGDDKYWIRMRSELLWLRDWGVTYQQNGVDSSSGIFGRIESDYLEMEILKVLLLNTRYTLARSIYESSPERPLSESQILDTVVTAAMNAYDNASNGNRTRGGVKKCDDILHAFPDTIEGTLPAGRIEHLLIVTHSISKYRLVLKQGEPFMPVVLRVHGDPISIIGKILDQNPKSYTKINDMVHMGEEMVRAGLTVRDIGGQSSFQSEQEDEQINFVKKRVISMCVDAALTEDDFETAYSYVTTRLSTVASEAQARISTHERGAREISAQTPPQILDDWSWRAALQAGKYRMKSQVQPTHLGNASGNLEIRHLEQRIDCLSQALRVAPPSTLQEILNVYRRCEEELDTQIRREAEQEAAWDEEGDQKVMPGGFGLEPRSSLSRPGATTGTAASRTGEEAPMSLFDLTRASAAQAQRSISVLTSLKSNISKDNGVAGSANSIDNTDVKPSTIRKRDQLRNAAVGTLASGIGWVLGAPPVVHQSGQGNDE